MVRSLGWGIMKLITRCREGNPDINCDCWESTSWKFRMEILPTTTKYHSMSLDWNFPILFAFSSQFSYFCVAQSEPGRSSNQQKRRNIQSEKKKICGITKLLKTVRWLPQNKISVLWIWASGSEAVEVRRILLHMKNIIKVEKEFSWPGKIKFEFYSTLF